MNFQIGWVYPEAKPARWRDIQFARLFGSEAVGVDKCRGMTIRGYWHQGQLYVTGIRRTALRGFDREPIHGAVPTGDEFEPVGMPPPHAV